MTVSGHVYILINASMEGLVKVGKTAGDPQARAKELSQATGVPTPFYVAFSLPFADCDSAERHLHTVLETNGFRVSESREFYRVPLQTAIKLLLEVQKRLTVIGSDQSDSPEVVQQDSTDTSADSEQLGAQLYEEAMGYFYGRGDVIEDRDRAVRLLEQAKRLDYPSAYTALADYFSVWRVPPDINSALRYLHEGAERGHSQCWIEMSKIYREQDHAENFNKCWKNYFLDRSSTQVADEDGRSKADRIREYFATIHQHGVPFHDGLRPLLLPHQKEVVQGIEALIREAAQNPSQQIAATLVKNSREFLAFVQAKLCGAESGGAS